MPMWDWWVWWRGQRPAPAAEETAEQETRMTGPMKKTASTRARLYVSYRPKRSVWVVTERGVELAAAGTKAAAVTRAVEMAHARAGAGERLSVYVRAKDGRIVDERTYPRSSDPHPPRG